MTFVLKRRCEDYFATTRQAERPRAIAFVDDRDATNLHVIAGCDAHLHADPDAMIATVELGHVRMKDNVRILGDNASRLSPHRPDQAAVLVANIDPEAVVIARCVGQTACQRLPMPPKAAAAGLRYPCAEAAIAEQMQLGEDLCGRGNPGMRRGHHDPARRGLSGLLFADGLGRKLPGNPFLEQEFHGSHPTVLAE